MEFRKQPKEFLSEKILVDEKPEQIKQSASIKDVFLSTLIEFCSESSADCISFMFKRKNWLLKLFWFILFCAGSGASAYCKYILLSYLSKTRTVFKFEFFVLV